MLLYAIAGLVTFVFTTVLTIAGVGAAFILIPVFDWLGIPFREAMAVALLLNSIAMIFASRTYIRYRLVVFRTAIPILIIATLLSPVGAYTNQFFPIYILKWLFVGFLVFAGTMMLFYRPKVRDEEISPARATGYGVGVGSAAGYLGGLLGIGGGNFIVPMLVWLGFDPKKASATTSFIVIFSSFSGFLGHATFGSVNLPLLAFASVGSIVGAIVGAHLMTRRLESAQVKKIIGWILYGIAVKMAWGLL
ncbi:MAG: sulfite exporter TauE/SafE family protein [Candidatus Syntropharchaeales archaeon]